MATVGDVCNMHTNQMCLTLIDENVFYVPFRVVKEHMPYIEIRDDRGFVAVCYSDSSA